MKSIDLIIPTDNSYSDFGKVSGWRLCFQTGISTFSELHIIHDWCTQREIENSFSAPYLFCRADAPIGYGNKLPRGRIIPPAELYPYVREVSKVCNQAVVLVYSKPEAKIGATLLRNPSRSETSGAIMVIMENKTYVYIEHVGKGFDIGDITRGKAVHNSIRIPWDILFEDPSQIYRSVYYDFPMYSYHVSETNYSIQRLERINQITSLNEEKNENCGEKIPYYAEFLTLTLFKKIFEELINKVILQQLNLRYPTIGIMINIYEGNFCALEIWTPSRSK